MNTHEILWFDQIRKVADTILRWCERATQVKHWTISSALIAWFIGVLACAPGVEEFVDMHVWLEGQRPVIEKIADPFRDMSDYPAAHTAAKRSFRITAPLIARVIGLNIYGLYVIQWILGFVILAMIARLVERWAQDRVVALLATVLFATIYPGSAAFLEYWGLFDTFAYAFLIIAVYFRHPSVITISLVLAAFTDERALVASPGVILAHTLFSRRGEIVRLKDFAHPQTCAVLASWLLYGAGRWSLSTYCGLKTPSDGVGFEVLLQFKQLHVLHIGLWGVFEAGWLIILLAVLGWCRKGQSLYLAGWMLSLSASIFVATLVYDITRSASYALLLLLVAIYAVADTGNTRRVAETRSMRELFLFAALLSLAALNYRVFGAVSTPVPLPFEAAKAIYLFSAMP